MRLSTKGRHAVAAMIDLALRAGRGPVSLTATSRRRRISSSYLEATPKDLAADQLAHGVSVDEAPGRRALPSRSGAATW